MFGHQLKRHLKNSSTFMIFMALLYAHFPLEQAQKNNNVKL